jgi:hypothetical protein
MGGLWVRLVDPPWIGQRHAVFVPVIDSHVDLDPVPDFVERILRRIFYDPHPSTGVDRALQRYVSQVSYGKASLAATVTDVVVSNTPDTMGAARKSIPEDNPYDVVVAVLSSGGPDRDAWAWWDNTPISGIGDFCRVNLDEGLGTWAMEITHSLTSFGDLYNFNPHLGPFDNMACNCGTHPSVHTLVHLQWLAQSAVAVKADHGEDVYTLHPVGLSQPAPPGHVMAVRTPARSGSTYYMVEARIRSDPYESPSYASSGIPTEGVIVYEVADKLEVYLRTPSALKVGESFSPEAGLDIAVIRERYGDFRVTVDRHLEANERLVPHVRFDPVGVADTHVRSVDLVPQFTGPTGAGTFVFTQSPVAGTIVDVGAVVRMTTRRGPTP